MAGRLVGAPPPVPPLPACIASLRSAEPTHGASMSTKRRSYESGHKRKYLLVIDERDECDRAVYWAAKRAGRTKSQIVMLRVIEPGERNQQWLGVADLMAAEQQEAAEKLLDKYAARA